AFTGGLVGPPGRRFDHQGDLEGTPALLTAGDPDPHVPWERVEETAAVLRRMGAEVDLRRYPGRPHAILTDELDEARRVLARALADPS
ncbi:MAG TPA: prolyl oligopeptidase family serine peptidase, partial [Thermoanaerobaculia bacterium]|nr:prolyl oligopeptidase family serine peptidase [Thermoanaerobaculia bacterium]